MKTIQKISREIEYLKNLFIPEKKYSNSIPQMVVRILLEKLKMISKNFNRLQVKSNSFLKEKEFLEESKNKSMWIKSKIKEINRKNYKKWQKLLKKFKKFLLRFFKWTRIIMRILIMLETTIIEAKKIMLEALIRINFIQIICLKK